MDTKTCTKTTKETPKVNLVNSLLLVSKLIFKAVMFKTLGNVYPKKEKTNPKKKREIMLLYLVTIKSKFMYKITILIKTTVL